MYAPRAGIEPELGDVEVIAAGEQLHLFHLTPPNNDAVAHAVSEDGLTWRELPVAIRTGAPGACDDDQIWTMSVTEREDGSFVMLYTALATAERGRVQRCAIATSTDLVTWTKHEGNPVAEADPRWYEADPSASGRVSWRDPKPVNVGDTYYAAVAGRECGGPLVRRGCVGLMASDDLVTWEVRPPLFAPRRYWDLECPQVFELGGRFYLTAAIMENRHQRYWVAPSFEGPYEPPADGGLLAPLGHYAGRVVEWQGQRLLFAWHKMARAGAWIEYDWPGTRVPLGKYMVAPLVLEPREDGSLARRSFPAWSQYRTEPLGPAAPQARTVLHERESAGWLVTSLDGMDVLATEAEAADCWIEGTLRIDAGLGGLAFRLDEAGGGYFVDLTVGSDEVLLQKWLPATHADGTRPWFKRVELQRGHLRQPLAPDEALPFSLLLMGPYIELSLAGEVVISTLSWERRQGRVGVWVDSGTLVAESVRWAPMRAPAHG